MTAAPRPRGGRAAAPAQPLFQVDACPACRSTVLLVKTPDGARIRLDSDPDPLGGWLAVQQGRQWRVQPAPPVPGGERYRKHSCTGMVASTAWKHVRSGPCAGGCGVLLPVKYGPAVGDTLCSQCRKVLDRWRAGQRRPLVIPYGTWVDGVYNHPVGLS